MTRNLTSLALVAMLFALCWSAEAQQAKIHRVGVLGPPGKLEERRPIKGFLDGLRESGYVQGKNLQLHIPHVKTYDELRPIARDYVEKKTDVIATSGGTATGIAKRQLTKYRSSSYLVWVTRYNQDS